MKIVLPLYSGDQGGLCGELLALKLHVIQLTHLKEKILLILRFFFHGLAFRVCSANWRSCAALPALVTKKLQVRQEKS